jgi:hypothetical protein
MIVIVTHCKYLIMVLVILLFHEIISLLLENVHELPNFENKLVCSPWSLFLYCPVLFFFLSKMLCFSHVKMRVDTYTWKQCWEYFCIAILNSTSKNTLSSLLCLSLFFNKISDKGRTEPAWSWGGKGREDGRGGQGTELTQTMYAHVNKWIKKKRRE